jgi:disulfide bond formation protein DsbB
VSLLSVIANLLAILSLVALALVILLAALWFVRRGSGDVLGLDQLDARGWLSAATLVAAIAMAGSLYFSEVVHFIPCELCWYQRIAMYPLVPLLGLAAWRRDTGIRPYALALAGLGAPISAWHVLVERFPTLEGPYCDPAAPCSAIWVNTFGYLTIPTMALSGFLLIAVLLLVAGPEPELEEGDEAGVEVRSARPEAPVPGATQ